MTEYNHLLVHLFPYYLVHFIICVPAMARAHSWILPYLIMYSYCMYVPTKFRLAISAAPLTKPWQYIHQNVRLGRERSAIIFLAETRYRGDVIRKKRRQKTPLKVNGGKQKR